MDPEVCSAHCKMAQSDLHMKDASDHMAHHDEEETILRIWNRLVYYSVTEPGPEEDLSTELKPSMPPGWPFPRSKTKQEEFPAKAVQVEATKSEDRIIEEILISNCKFCEPVIGHYTVIIRTP